MRVLILNINCCWYFQQKTTCTGHRLAFFERDLSGRVQTPREKESELDHEQWWIHCNSLKFSFHRFDFRIVEREKFTVHVYYQIIWFCFLCYLGPYLEIVEARVEVLEESLLYLRNKVRWDLGNDSSISGSDIPSTVHVKTRKLTARATHVETREASLHDLAIRGMFFLAYSNPIDALA